MVLRLKGFLRGAYLNLGLNITYKLKMCIIMKTSAVNTLRLLTVEFHKNRENTVPLKNTTKVKQSNKAAYTEQNKHVSIEHS